MNGGSGWHQSLTGVVRRTFEAAFEDNIPFLASGLSFDLLLTAIPFAALVLGTIGYLAQHQVAAHQVTLHALLQRFIPGGSTGRGVDAFNQVETMLNQIVAQRGRLTLYALPLFVWFATRFFSGLRIALNDVFDTDEVRPWPVAKGTDLAMMVVTATLVGANALLPAFEVRNTVLLRTSFFLEWMWRLGLEITAFGFGTVLFYLIFKLLPGRRIHWRTALVAATFCALAFEVAKRLYTLYLARFATLDRVASDANVVALFLFLLWTYYTAFVFLLGAEVAETYDLMRLRRTQRVQLG
ncbi:MAG TPA: YihY/virulence factor BrkB family protein [Gemmatimonadales bacterium]|nr:YihY/virulence factor BrkB family protein [Gemmatimonadales bacterium]